MAADTFLEGCMLASPDLYLSIGIVKLILSLNEQYRGLVMYNACLSFTLLEVVS